VEKKEGLISEHEVDGDEKEGILPNWLSEWFSNTKSQTANYVLLARK